MSGKTKDLVDEIWAHTNKKSSCQKVRMSERKGKEGTLTRGPGETNKDEARTE